MSAPTQPVEQIHFQVPVPPSGLRPNARKHPRSVARWRRQFGSWVYCAAREALGPPPWPRWERATLQLEAVYPSGRHHWDDDAIVTSFKSGRDALVTLGIIPDDSPRYLVALPVLTRVDREARGAYLVVTLTEA